jgi:hypothetical protein
MLAGEDGLCRPMTVSSTPITPTIAVGAGPTALVPVIDCAMLRKEALRPRV